MINRKNNTQPFFDEKNSGYFSNLVLKKFVLNPDSGKFSLLYPVFGIHALRRGACWLVHHRFPYLAVSYLLSGTISVKQFGRTERIHAGEAYLVHRNENSTFFSSDGENYEKLVIGISGTVIEMLTEELGLGNRTKIIPAFPDKLEKQMRSIIFLLSRRPVDNRMLSCRTYELLLGCSSPEDRTSGQYPKELQLAIQACESSLKGTPPLQMIAARAGISTATLNRMFRKYLDSSPLEYIMGLRMKMAKELLLNTDFPIKNIADRCGFSNQLYFSTFFRKNTGFSPTDFRQGH